MKTHISAVKLAVICAWLFAGSFLFSENSFAQSCPYSWPTISADWPLYPESKYTAGGVSGGIVLSTATACDCGSVNVGGGADCSVYIDGQLTASCGGWIPFQFSVPDVIPEGAHNANIQFTAHGCDMVQSYSFQKDFYVDKTSPLVSFTKPATDVSISTADLVIAGDFSDAMSKVGVVTVQLGISKGPCQFNRDLFGVAVASVSIRSTYCSNYNYTGEVNQLLGFCNANVGTLANFTITHDLRNYVDFSHGQDCGFSVSVGGVDSVGNQAEIKNLYFLVDQQPPLVVISSLPVVLSSGPATLIAGTVADSSEIGYIKLSLAQLDWKGTTTYWNGAEWVTDPTTVVNVDIPLSTNTINWAYSGLTGQKIISGSHYRLTVYVADIFDHIGVAEEEFDYNACKEGIINHPPQTTHKFEVGDAVFRELGSPGFKNKGHTGVYILSDSNYQLGQSSRDFVNELKAKGSLRDIVGSDARHYIVEATGYKTFLIDKDYAKAVSIDEYIAGGKYWGAKTATTPIEASKRDKIAYYATLQLGKIYELAGKNWAGGTGADPAGFRCDGLVIYAYEKADINLVPSDKKKWNKMSPKKLFSPENNYMADSVVDYPVLQSVSIMANPDNSSLNILATPYDASSGIDRLEHYLYTLDGNTLRKIPLLEDEVDSIPSQVHNSTCACNPGGNLITRLVDRAGNWAAYDYSKNRQESSDSQEPSVTVSPDSTPILDAPVITPYNNSLAYNIPLITDDITASSSTLLFYRVDLPYDDWDDDAKTTMLESGLATGNFAVAPGPHKLYTAVMDESLNFTTIEKDFKVPGLASAGLGSGARLSIGDVAVSFDNLTSLASISANDMEGGSLPAGYSNLPKALSKEITIDGTYNGGFMVLMSYANYGVTSAQEPYLQMLHNGQNITVALDKVNKLIGGYATSASPFTVAVSQQLSPESSLPDVWPPFTSINLAGSSYTDSPGRHYISTSALIGLHAEDDRIGIINRYYTLDMTEPRFTTGLVPASLGQFTLYSSSFTAPEGICWTGYGAVDVSGNYELLKTTTFYVDGTPPSTQLSVRGVTLASGATAYITINDSTTLTAVDPVSNGVASDRKATYLLIDIYPASCLTVPDLVGPAGTCRNPFYSGPFSLTVGTHTIYFAAEDNVGNMEAGKSVFVDVKETLEVRFSPTTKTVDSVLWQWDLIQGATGYRLFSSTGGALSELLTGSATSYSQTGLTPNTVYYDYLKAYSSGGDFISAISSAATLAFPPSGLTAVSVTSSTVNLSWAANFNPVPGTNFELWRDISASFDAPIKTIVQDIYYQAQELLSGTTHYFKIRVLSNGGNFTDFDTTLVSTATWPPVPGQAGTPVGTALGVSSIVWNWSSAPYGQSYNIFQATDTSSLIASVAALSYAQTGLSSNTAYGIVAAGINPSGQGALSLPATVYTLAAPPSGSSVSNIWVTSAAISWGLNGNPAGTIADAQRSADNSPFASIFLGAALSATDTGLESCTTYYYKVRNRNGDGFYSDYASAIQFITMGSTPSAAGDLSAESLTGNRIGLSWGFSPSEGVTQYQLYYDSGTGTIDYNTPLTVFSSTAASWISGVLTSSASYKFGLRTKNRCGIEEANTSLFASAASLGSLTGVRAAIRVPQSGKRINGNSVTVVAGLLLGGPEQAKQVLFQYRLLGAANWTDVTAANVNHPNPDLSSTYLIQWDVTGLVANTYELRAVATDIANTVDPAPPSITIAVDSVDYDIKENSFGGKDEKEQKVNNAVPSTVQASDEGSSLLTKVLIPSGAFDTSTITVKVSNAPVVKPPPPTGAEDLGVVTKIELSNGQSLLSGGKTAVLTLNYKDDDDNGVVDGTSVKVDSLKMYTAATSAGPWVLLPSTVEKANKCVNGTTVHFSFFGVFATSAADLRAVRVYPNPYKPNGGNADEGAPYNSGNPNSGIIFDNLTDRVTIKIYTVTGQLVAKFSSMSSGGKIQWDAKNDSGKNVASGGYVAVIASPGHSDAVKKILIVR